MWGAGALYFAIVFIFAFGFGAVRTLALEPRLGETWAVAAETPLLVMVMFFTARWVTARTRLGAAGLLGMGVFALALQQIAELAMVRMGGESLSAYAAYLATPAGLIFIAGLTAFALMPLLVGRGTK